MLDRLGLERTDRRNLLVVMAVVAGVMAVVSSGTPFVRLVVGLVAGLISGVVFVVSTAVINRYKPAHW
jgi:drug/metabolite transporter (DMT)-like permease